MPRNQTIKKNKRIILIQKYRYFNSKADDSLTDKYDNFLTMLNDMSLIKKEYDDKDSTEKFSRLFLNNGISKPPL